MGIVYRAWQVNLTRWVALKLVRDPSLASHAEIRRFRIEAEAVAQLKHNNIVPIYEVGQIDDQPYFSMLLIEGGNLATTYRGSRTSRGDCRPDGEGCAPSTMRTNTRSCTAT